ncbi:MAG: type IX secretion system membrane protein PorP/SprF [Bacteroidetes bacterium]|jgi:hypothetical protein|nr:type IX secretion system membrane protein PorP/SprF [Bacteroidota bacterium]
MYRFNTILTLLLISINILSGQHTRKFVPAYHYLHNNALTTALNEQSFLLMDYQNYWPEIPSVFNTISLGYHQYLEAMGGAAGIGITRNSEAGGRISQTLGHISYSQRLRLSRDGYLAVGLVSSIAYNSRADLDVVVPGTEVPETDIGTGTVSSPDFSVGAGYKYKNHNMGIYYNNILNAFENSNTYFEVAYNYRYDLSGRFYDDFISPVAVFNYYPANGFFTQIAGLTGSYKSVLFNIYEQGGGEQVINNIIIGGGYKFFPYTLHYAYSANVNNFSLNTGRNGAHEVTFLVELQYKGKRNKRGAIKCPDI